MEGREPPPAYLGPNDVTVDSDLSSSNLDGDDHGPRVRLIAGQQTPSTDEFTNVLRRRLFAASIVLASGFGVFFLWRLISSLLGLGPSWVGGTFFSQLAVALLLLGCVLSLRRKRPLSTVRLRVKELLIFGAPATFFFGMQYVMMRDCAAKANMLPSAEAPWIMLMFTYAMFIPNTWRRAAVVIGMMALSPIALALVLWMTDQMCAQLIRDDLWSLGLTGLIMLVSGVSAAAGVYTINALRQEAMEARQLGQYRLGRLLGSGGMGEVYLGEHLLMKRPCAIKVIRPEKNGERRALARFEREVRATAKLSHWNNIDIFDYGRAADGTFYYVMEYLPGMSLAELVERFGPVQPERVIFLLRQTCHALTEAHNIGLIHRDIKPANIFAAQRGGRFDVAKLLDFGMVKPLDSIEPSELTHDGTITGSPLFMSPEQALGDREPDVRSDIYSLGVVAYYLLSGKPPFDGNHALKVLFAHANREPPPLSAVVPDVPSDLEHVVMRCLAKPVEDRYQSARELAAALQACEHAARWNFEKAAQWWRQVADVAPPNPKPAGHAMASA